MGDRTFQMAVKVFVIVALFLPGSARAVGVRQPVSGRFAPFAAAAPNPAGRLDQANQQPSPGTTTGVTTSEAAEIKPEVKTYVLPPEKYKRAVEFARARYRLYPIEVVYGILVLWVILHWGLAVRFRDFAEAKSSRRLVPQSFARSR